jgi:hypothetical protein
MWKSGRGPLDLDQRDLAVLERHRLALASELVVGSQYYVVRQTGLGAVTAAHCEGFLHRFEADGAHTSIYKRCREGWLADGWPLDRLNVTVPLAASSQHQLPFDRSLCEAILTTADSGTDLGSRLGVALPAFLQGNSLSNSTTLIDDMVWMGAAFERLLGVTSPGIGSKLSEAIRDHLAGISENQTSWTPLNARGDPTKDSQGLPVVESGPWRQRWMREFYLRRSAVHSGSSEPGDWTDQFHAVIAAETFSIAVLRLLADAGIRPLTDDESDRQDALDHRIEALSTRPRDVEELWDRLGQEAQKRRIVARAAQALANEPTTLLPE